MFNVNILSFSNHPLFLRQIDYKLFPSNKYYFSENSNQNIIWDIVVVYENIKKPFHLKYKSGGLIFISGEPPMSNVYTQKFINQFDHLISSHPNLKHVDNNLIQQSLNWHYGYSFSNRTFSKNFEDLKNMIVPIKTKNISVITSSQTMMSGHCWRIKVINKLKETFGGSIDFYGKGINFIDDKASALDPYKFHICIENSNIPNYWTEKFADPLLSYSIPIYAGCKNINNYFDDRGFFVFDYKDFNSLKSILNNVLLHSDEIYQRMYPYMISNRNKLLYEYNLFPFIYKFYLEKIFNYSNNIVDVTIFPNDITFIYKFLLYKLRIHRFVLKQIINRFL